MMSAQSRFTRAPQIAGALWLLDFFSLIDLTPMRSAPLRPRNVTGKRISFLLLIC